MEPFGHRHGPQHPYVVCQEEIQRCRKLLSRVTGASEKIRHLALGVRPGIGAARSPDTDSLAGETSQSLFQGPLNRRLVKLRLKPVVIGALILNPEGKPSRRALGVICSASGLRKFVCYYLRRSVRPAR